MLRPPSGEPGVAEPAESAEPAEVRRALDYVRTWTTIELLCALHPHRRDHSAAERRAATLALRERGFRRPAVLLLSLLTLPSVRDAWDGGAGVADVLRGWAAVALVATGVAAPLATRTGDAHLVRRVVVAGAAVSLALFALALLGRRRRGPARRPR